MGYRAVVYAGRKRTNLRFRLGKQQCARQQQKSKSEFHLKPPVLDNVSRFVSRRIAVSPCFRKGRLCEHKRDSRRFWFSERLQDATDRVPVDWWRARSTGRRRRRRQNATQPGCRSERQGFSCNPPPPPASERSPGGRRAWRRAPMRLRVPPAPP